MKTSPGPVQAGNTQMGTGCGHGQVGCGIREWDRQVGPGLGPGSQHGIGEWWPYGATIRSPHIPAMDAGSTGRAVLAADCSCALGPQSCVIIASRPDPAYSSHSLTRLWPHFIHSDKCALSMQVPGQPPWKPSPATPSGNPGSGWGTDELGCQQQTDEATAAWAAGKRSLAAVPPHTRYTLGGRGTGHLCHSPLPLGQARPRDLPWIRWHHLAGLIQPSGHIFPTYGLHAYNWTGNREQVHSNTWFSRNIFILFHTSLTGLTGFYVCPLQV